MFGSLRGMVIGVVVVAGASTYAVIDRGVNYKEAKASVVMIDRKCDFTETRKKDTPSLAGSPTRATPRTNGRP